MIKDTLQIPWLGKKQAALGQMLCTPRAHLKTTGGCRGVQEELGGVTELFSRETGIRLEVGVGGNEGSENRASIGNQQLDRIHWHQGLGPGGQLDR